MQPAEEEPFKRCSEAPKNWGLGGYVTICARVFLWTPRGITRWSSHHWDGQPLLDIFGWQCRLSQQTTLTPSDPNDCSFERAFHGTPKHTTKRSALIGVSVQESFAIESVFHKIQACTKVALFGHPRIRIQDSIGRPWNDLNDIANVKEGAWTHSIFPHFTRWMLLLTVVDPF